MRRALKFLFRKPLIWLANKLSSSPKRKSVFESLTNLLTNINQEKSGAIIPFDINAGRFIIFSDHHKGTRDMADDFRHAEPNYLAALQHYFNNDFSLIALGDCEELWESPPDAVIEKNRLCLLEEAKFLVKDRYTRIFGNHDLEWKYLIQQTLYLKPVFGDKLKVFEGVVLRTLHNGKPYSIFLTHGHQGDRRSDGNFFSTWVVAAIWTPLQRYFEISTDTISDSFDLVDKHNIMMYEWSARQQDLIFISGHTHKPVFASLDHIDKLSRQVEKARETGDQVQVQLLQQQLQQRQAEYAGKNLVRSMARPSYFNSGCCCFNDGDITGIEIADGMIRLIKWEMLEDNTPKRRVLEEAPLEYLFEMLEG